jgi:hypothetical protein
MLTASLKGGDNSDLMCASKGALDALASRSRKRKLGQRFEGSLFVAGDEALRLEGDKDWRYYLLQITSEAQHPISYGVTRKVEARESPPSPLLLRSCDVRRSATSSEQTTQRCCIVVRARACGRAGRFETFKQTASIGGSISFSGPVKDTCMLTALFAVSPEYFVFQS